MTFQFFPSHLISPFSKPLVGSGSARTTVSFSDQKTENTFPQSALWGIHYSGEQWFCLVESHTRKPGGRRWRLLHQFGGRQRNSHGSITKIIVCILLYILMIFFPPLQPVNLSDREVISRLRNCLLALAAHKVLLYDTSVLYCYESSLQHQV